MHEDFFNRGSSGPQGLFDFTIKNGMAPYTHLGWEGLRNVAYQPVVVKVSPPAYVLKARALVDVMNERKK